METITLKRGASTDQGTFGELTVLTVNLSKKFLTIELPWRDVNQDGVGDSQKSCITPGTYRCTWHKSPSRGWVYLLNDVKGRSHILIHSANFAGDVDKGWHSELLGCIALGYKEGAFSPDGKKKVQKALLQSKLACKDFYSMMQQKDFMLEIV